MEKKTYATSDQTKHALATALKELMAQKPFDKITIHDITERCGIRRQNFYYHFADVYDLMRWMFEEEAISLLEAHEGALLWQDGLLQLFRYLEENRAVCLCALNSVGRPILKRFFENDMHEIIRRTVDKLSVDVGAAAAGVSQDDVDLMTHWYILSFVGIMESWLVGEIDRTPEELVAFGDQILQDHIRGAKMRFAEVIKKKKSASSL